MGLLKFFQRGRNGLWSLCRAVGSNGCQTPSLTALPSNFESSFPFVARRRSFNPLVKHTGRYDRRYPGVGLLTLDEAAILFNCGLAMEDETLIEIGGWEGWSTAAWALSGVQVVAIDPALNGLPQGESCRASLAEQERSIESISRATARTAHWLGQRVRDCGLAVFIDGDHDGEAPLRDAIEAQAVAADDCLIAFH
jgi:hypothetical protein